MPNRDDILWFKTQFQARIEPLVAGTPLTVDFLAALACQETGEIWPRLRRAGLPVERVLALCCGDTLDADKGRRAFPPTKADLLAVRDGDRMFTIARQALIDMAQHITEYQPVAQRPNKFCHGFGIFQLDLQFFKTDPDYFLERRYEQFEASLGKAIDELKRALKKLRLDDRDTLSDQELAAVGICYNTGGFNPAKGLQQGHFNGRFYGEAVLDYLRQAHTVAVEGAVPVIAVPPPGVAPLAPPTEPTADGQRFRVDNPGLGANVRSEPRVSVPDKANVTAFLPDGHPVRATGPVADSAKWVPIQGTLKGSLVEGFVFRKLLAPDDTPQPRGRALPRGPAAGAAPAMPAAHLPAREGRVTRRRDPANAFSLNEPRQPGRSGSSPDELRAELGAIVDWLAVDDERHLRYQPRNKATFCNIYAHDYCHLAGVYLPRVWWTGPALLALGRGETVLPRIDTTVHELRANDLFRWLADFGEGFGWRRTGTLTKLQTEVNLGAVGLVIARRKVDGLSGHVVAVVPEGEDARARRDAAGEVLAPLQSQAGARNFRRGTGKAGWWLGEDFADFAFWVHA